jgi:hypothetical protein
LKVAHVFVVCNAAVSPGLCSIHWRPFPLQLVSFAALACQSNVIGTDKGSVVCRGVDALPIAFEGSGDEMSRLSAVVVRPSVLPIEGVDDVLVVFLPSPGCADARSARASAKARGSARPRLSARRKIPAAALGLK